MSGRDWLRRRNLHPGLSLLLAAAVLYACHYAVLARGFLLPFVDADQLVIADMAAHFAGGAFPEPFFWGQDYLLPVEAYQNVVHPQWAVSFSFRAMAASLGDRAVAGPVVRAGLWIPLAAVLLVAFVPASRPIRSRRFWLALALVGILVLGMLGTSKIGDAAPSVFFSAHRFWLALPYALVAIALQAGLDAPRGRPAANGRAVWLLLAWGVVSIAATHVRLGPLVSAEISRRAPVAVAPRAQIADACRTLARSIDRRQYYFAIDGRHDLLAYGCFPLAGVYVTQTDHERRTWLARALGTRTPLPLDPSRPRF